jgi:hypothetical protein
MRKEWRVSIPRMAMAGEMFGKRPVGKPKKSWMEAVKDDSFHILKYSPS